MSTVALDRQNRWSCRLQESNSHLQPPDLKAQPLPVNPLTSPFPPLPKQASVPSYFPLYVSPQLNSTAFQFCFLSSSSPTVGLLGVSRCLVPHISSGLQSTNQVYDSHLLPVFALHHVLPPLPRPPCPHQAKSAQNSSFPPPLVRLKSVSSHFKDSGHQPEPTLGNPSHSCCSPGLIQVSSSPNSSNNPGFGRMHAQAVSGNLAVTTTECFSVQQENCPSEGLLQEPNSICQKHDPMPCTCKNAVKYSVIEPTTVVSNAGGHASKTIVSTCPAFSTVRIVSSSSVPKSVDSNSCNSDIIATSVASSTSHAELKSVGLGSDVLCSKSNSQMCQRNAPPSDDETNVLEQNKIPSTDLSSPNEGTLSIQRMGDSLTTEEEESSSFDSGQDDSSDSSKGSYHRRRKSQQVVGSCTQQESNGNAHIKNVDMVLQNEGTQCPRDESPSSENRKGVLPYTKSNSRGNVGGKCKVSSCCPRRRLVDDEGYIRRAACICVNKEETKVLLISSKKDRCAWLVPGGGLEVGEDPTAAATREAWEEAGVLGHIARYLGLFESYHHSGLKKHRTAVYIFTVTEEHNQFPEARLGRTRQWFSLEEALLHLTHHRPLQSAYLQLMMMSTINVTASS